MRTLAILALGLALAAAASPAAAGRLFGDIKLDGKPLPAGVPVKIALAAAPGAVAKPGAPADSTATDKFGSYKLTVKSEGKCVLTLIYEKRAVTLDVFSYKDATRYDLILEKKDGAFILRRK